MRFAILLLAFVAVAQICDARNLRRLRRDAESPASSGWSSGMREFGSKLKRMGSQTMINVKDGMSQARDQIQDAVTKYSNDPKALMERIKALLPAEFYQQVQETLKRMGLSATPQNVENVVNFSLVAIGVPSFLASRVANPLTVQIFRALGRDITTEKQPQQLQKETSIVSTLDLSHIDPGNSGNIKLNLVPGSKASLGEPLADGRKPVLMQLIGQLEYIPPIVPQKISELPAIEAAPAA